MSHTGASQLTVIAGRRKASSVATRLVPLIAGQRQTEQIGVYNRILELITQ